jgi:leucyl/phenylalanyl-tRNA--protein transferase
MRNILIDIVLSTFNQNLGYLIAKSIDERCTVNGTWITNDMIEAYCNHELGEQP